MKDELKLANQVCFPIYVLAKEMVNHYRPFLEKLDLTYPQYLVMLVLWEERKQTVGELGEKLQLDNGTLTPLLKRLEQKGYVSRTRSDKDERIVNITCTDLGISIQEKACGIREQLLSSMEIAQADIIALKDIVNRILNKKP